MVRPAHLGREEDDPEDDEDATDGSVRRGRRARRRTRGRAPDPAARRRAGPRASRTRRAAAVADGQDGRQPEDARQRPAEAVDEQARRAPARPRSRSARRRRRSRSSSRDGCCGVTSRIPASMTPVLPSWNPISSIDERELPRLARRAPRPANTTASTSALRTMTALRLYLSAQTPHSGTSGSADDEDERAEQADEREAIRLGDAHLAQVGADSAKIWLTPSPSTIDVIQKTPTRIRQSCGRARRAGRGRGRMGATARDYPTAAPRGRRGRRGAHESARRNCGRTGRSAGPVAPNKSGVSGRRRVPRSLALRPSNPVPGTVPRITPRSGLAVRTCPFGQDEMYPPGPGGHNALSTNFARRGPTLSPSFPPMWTGCGEATPRASATAAA